MYTISSSIHSISKTSVSKNSINKYCAPHQELISYLVAYEHLINLIWLILKAFVKGRFKEVKTDGQEGKQSE